MNKTYHIRFFQRIPNGMKRILSAKLAVYMFFSSVFTFIPNQSFALTGGPSQPEVQSFEPMGTNDMVNVFSGDFTYNIPLLDVEGYPINLSYNSGITTDQEASWTGLGWNINVGTINRGLRGLPDDFNGDKVTTELSMKPNRTYNLGGGIDLEIFGKKTKSDKLKKLNSSLNLNLGVSYNNYTGIGMSFGGGIDYKGLSPALTGGLGFNSSSENGLSITPNISLNAYIKNKEKQNETLDLSIGASSSFNSRSTMKNLSISGTGSYMSSASGQKKIMNRKIKAGKSSVNFNRNSSASFNMGQSTYTPSVGVEMSSFNMSARFKLGIAAWGADAGAYVNANYSSQWVKESAKEKESPAYGYFHTEKGQNNENALLDFNRENDGSVSNQTPALPITNYTNDVFSVTGQGVGGSYRPYRNQISYVSDPVSKSTSSSINIGVETSPTPPSGVHIGVNPGLVINNSKSGKWKSRNDAVGDIAYDQTKPYNDFEQYHLREANEMSVASDQTYYDRVGGEQAARFKLDKGVLFSSRLKNQLELENGTTKNINNLTRSDRDKRNSIITTKTVGQVKLGMGFNGATAYPTNSYAASAPDHHIGEIVSLGTDGMRYVYGIPAYNKSQQEVTFSVGDKLNGNPYTNTPDCTTGLIEYTPGEDNTKNNEWGLDNYYQKKITPGYAHSFLLTSVVSPDYVDLDDNGPSEKDLGTYTKFNYEKVTGDYKWRTPVEANTASYQPGLNADPTDDKASYVYGEKELWYLETIETKNFVAVFETSNRNDGRGVDGENGGITSGAYMKKLDKITLYAKPDYDANGTGATPLKEVHFVYKSSDELCQDITNNASAGGKLTLEKVYFTYRGSKKGQLSPYIFDYEGTNRDYNLKAYDRWGTYQPNNATSCDITSVLGSMEYPYTTQDKDSADVYSAAWTLTSIQLPSGGKINVEYESDDYSFVQNREAMQMFKIVGVGDLNDNIQTVNSDGTSNLVEKDGVTFDKFNRLYFELDPNHTGPMSDYIDGQQFIYYKALMKFSQAAGAYDYVPGYAEINQIGEKTLTGLGNVGFIDFKTVDVADPINAGDYSPIAVAAAQFARLNLARIAWEAPMFDENTSFGKQLLSDLYKTFASNFADKFRSPNKSMLERDRGSKMVINKSFIRLNTVSNAKLGGGVRVKSVKMLDNWNTMTDGEEDGFDYGQEYDYTDTYVENGVEKTRSSGVASYEPQIGGDENPFKQVYFYEKGNIFAPNERFYQEEPFGESFFPSASVGYSKVTVRNLQRTNVKRNATGKVVHEFYTCKDYPTITRMTQMDHKRSKNDPLSVLSILGVNFDDRDFFAATQGFVVELNDMHGKPKAQRVYQEDNISPITEVNYFYKDASYSVRKNALKDESKRMDADTRRLANSVSVIHQNGTIDQRDIGLTFDAVADFRESKNTTLMPSAQLNVDAFILGIIPTAVPSIWPSYKQQRTRFRSAGFTKVINRFGILDKTVAKDLGSVVETKNLAYDAETGEVLLTETTTNFDDKIYTLNYPAYWHYDQMGPAYENIGVTGTVVLNNGSTTDYSNYFTEGDEVLLVPQFSNQYTKAWVVAKENGEVDFQLFDGSIPTNGIKKFEIVRSGRRNMQMQNMASITTLTNPLNSFSTNLYENVVQASAIEFSDQWRTYCDCFTDEEGDNITYNPYVLGEKGNWRPIRSYLPLSDRVQSDKNDNTNIRKDGVFERYRPYYNLLSGEWEVQSEDWTFTSSVTEFNSYGQELENQDALGRYSAATFGFNQTLTKAVAANARIREIGFSSFEDDDFSECADNHFKFDQSGLVRDANNSHTGVYSVKVTPSTPATLTRDLDWCDPNACELNATAYPFHPAIPGSPPAILLSNVTGSVTLSWELVSGLIPNTFNIISEGEAILFSTESIYDIKFTWQDENNCITAYQLTSTDTTSNFDFIKLK